MQGYQIFQPDGGGACYGVSLLDLVVMEREMVEHGAAAVIDGDRLLWRGDTEVVAMDAVRKARSSWPRNGSGPCGTPWRAWTCTKRRRDDGKDEF